MDDLKPDILLIQESKTQGTLTPAQAKVGSGADKLYLAKGGRTDRTNKRNAEATNIQVPHKPGTIPRGQGRGGEPPGTG